MSQAEQTRILRIIGQLTISGPALQTVLLTAHMAERGYHSTLLAGGTLQETDNMGYIAQQVGIEPLMLPTLASDLPLGSMAALPQLIAIMRDLRPHIVHTHNTRAGFVGRIAARMAGVPVIVHTLHEHPFRGYYNRLTTNLFIYMERAGAYFSDSIITLSEGLRRELTDTYRVTRRSRITVLPLGFDLARLAKTPRHAGQFRAAWGIAADVPLVGIIGRLLPVKNHRLFLQAAARIHAQRPDVHFVIVGDGEERGALEALVPQLGLSDVVRFTGWQQQVAQIYSDLDLLAISSWNEGTPVPIIEALAAGCPVVATNVGGIPDLLDGGALGTLVPSDDDAALAAAILSTLDQPPDTERAQQTMLDRYDIERLTHDLDSLYRGLLAKKAGSTP